MEPLSKKRLQHRSHHATSMSDLENIPISFSAVSDSNLTGLFFYGNDTKNRKILMPTTRFIKDSQTFDEQPW